MHQLVIKRFQHCLMHGVTMKFNAERFPVSHLCVNTLPASWQSESDLKLAYLTLRLLMSYIYMELLVKPEMLTSYIYGPTFGNAETLYFYLLHNVSTLNQCRDGFYVNRNMLERNFRMF